MATEDQIKALAKARFEDDVKDGLLGRVRNSGHSRMLFQKFEKEYLAEAKVFLEQGRA